MMMARGSGFGVSLFQIKSEIFSGMSQCNLDQAKSGEEEDPLTEDMCKQCNSNSEMVCHALWECPKIAEVWEEI